MIVSSFVLLFHALADESDPDSASLPVLYLDQAYEEIPSSFSCLRAKNSSYLYFLHLI